MANYFAQRSSRSPTASYFDAEPIYQIYVKEAQTQSLLVENLNIEDDCKICDDISCQLESSYETTSANMVPAIGLSRWSTQEKVKSYLSHNKMSSN